jgi:hypothetical protein
MNPTANLASTPRRFGPAQTLLLLLTASLACAQAIAPDAATLAKYDKNQNGRLDADETARLQATQAAAARAVDAAAPPVPAHRPRSPCR